MALLALHFKKEARCPHFSSMAAECEQMQLGLGTGHVTLVTAMDLNKVWYRAFLSFSFGSCDGADDAKFSCALKRMVDFFQNCL